VKSLLFAARETGKPGLIYRIHDRLGFKQSNLENWERNSAFWLQGKMRHLKDLWEPTAQLLLEVVARRGKDQRVTLFDFGCGEGWLLRLIQEKRLAVDYVGLDFNQEFVKVLREKYSGQEGIRFLHYDIENELPPELIASASVVANFFNFFELPNVQNGFDNAYKALKPDGELIMLTIDPLTQMFAATETRDEFLQTLREYEANQSDLGYDKDIDISEGRSGRVYKGLLYSTAVYVSCAKAAGLRLFDYREIVKTRSPVPQIYEYILFRNEAE
jgi:SAM-dependent methyltransferase